MAYDFFSQPQGPNIDVNLIPNAMKAGAVVGNAIPSTTKAVIDGVMSGVQAGQQIYDNYQNSQIKQNQIEQLPVANAMQEEQLESAQTQNEIRNMQLERERMNKDLIDEKTRLDLESANAQSKQELQNIKNRKEIEARLANPNPQVQMSVLEDPLLQQTLSSDSKFAGTVYGRLDPHMSPEQKESALKSLDYMKAAELDTRTRAADEKLRAQAAAKLDTEFDKMNEDGIIRGVIKGVEYKDVATKLEIHPAGKKQTNKDGMLDPNLSDNENKGWKPELQGYEAFLNGKKVAENLTPDQAAKVWSYQDAYQRALGIAGKPPNQTQAGPGSANFTGAPQAQGGATPQQAQQGSNQPQPQQQTDPFKVTDINVLKKNLQEQAGVDPEAADRILGTAEARGKDRNFVERLSDNVGNALSSVVPDFLKSEGGMFSGLMVGSGVHDSLLSADVRTTANNAATKLATETLAQYQNASPEEKADFEKWSKDNGVPLKFTSIRDYYKLRTLDALGSGYETAYQMGIDEMAKETRAQNAKQALKEEAEAITSLKDMPLDAVKQSAGNTGPEKSAAQITDRHSLLKNISYAPSENIGTKYNLSPKQQAQVAATMKNVYSQPLLRDASVEVKALAAVESGGKLKAVSPTGVKGYLQVTQKTAARYGLDRDDPEQGVLAGEMHINYLTNYFRGNKMLAYAAYNGGEGTIRYAQSLAQSAGADPDDWYQVRNYLRPAVENMKRSGRLPQSLNTAQKTLEIFKYPDKIMMHLDAFTAVESRPSWKMAEESRPSRSLQTA